MTTNRVPPNDVAAEAALLGAVMLRNDALDRIGLCAADFYDPRHREIFAAMRALQAQRKPIDAVTLEHELADKAASVGGLSFLGDLLDGVPTADNVEHYAAIVADASLKRRVLITASEIAARAFREDVTGEEMLTELATASVRISVGVKDGTLTIREAAMRTFRELQGAIEAKGRGEVKSLKLRTGIETLDAILRGGFPIGNVTLIAGRPSQGKSALARGAAASINAMCEGVHYFSTEDTTRALLMRQFADEADVDLAKLWDLDVGRLEWAAVSAAASALYERKGWLIDDARGISIGDIATRVRRRGAENGTKLVVIDYAQIIKAPGTRTPQERIAAVSEGASDLARQENVAVVLVSQLNRESDKRDDKRPGLSDLRGAGELEQDAEVVLIVHRPEHYLLQQNQESEIVQAQLKLWRGLGEILCVKAKNGPTGRTALAWDAKSATYRDRGRRCQEAA